MYFAAVALSFGDLWLVKLAVGLALAAAGVFLTLRFRKSIEIRNADGSLNQALFLIDSNTSSFEYRGVRLTYGMSIDYLVMPGIARHRPARRHPDRLPSRQQL